MENKTNVNDSVIKLADTFNSLKINNRPTFFIDMKPVRAAGILFYVHNRNKKYWLLRKCKGLYSDTGGKTDINDKSILDTAIRETVEETNGHLFSKKHSVNKCRKILIDQFSKNDIESIYIKKSKYILYLFELRWTNKEIPLGRFGEIEIHTNKPHSFHWVKNIPTDELHPRLGNISEIIDN